MARWVQGITAGVFLLNGAIFFAPAARAFPMSLSYSGRLTGSEGAPLPGPVALSIAFYRAAEGGEPLNNRTFELSQIVLKKGMFDVSVTLKASEVNAIFDQQNEVYIQVTDKTHAVVYPRQRYSPVPYALKIPIDNSSLAFNSAGNLALHKPEQLNIKAANGATVGIKAATTSTDGTVYTLPATVRSGLFMTTDASGNMAWDTPAVSSPGIADSAITDTKIAAGVSASKLIGTLPIGIFPTTLPATNGANLTNLNASNIASGTIDSARLDTGTTATKIVQLDASARIPAVNGSLVTNLNATNIASGTIDSARLDTGTTATKIVQLDASARIPAVNGSLVTNLNATNIASGTIDSARLDTGTTATKIVQLDASARIPAVDGSLVTSLNSANLSFRNGTVLFDDFMVGALSGTGLAGNGTLGWVYTVSGTSVWQPIATTDGNRPGILRATLGSAGNYAGLMLGSATNRTVLLDATNSGTITMEFAVAVPASGANTGTLYIGLADGVAAAPTMGTYFLITVAATSTYRGCTGSSCATGTSTINLANALYHVYTITITNNTSVDFKFDGTSITGSPLSTNIPAAAVMPIIRYAWVAGTGANISIDYFWYKQVFGTAR